MSLVSSSAAANPTGVCATTAYSQFPTNDTACAAASTAGLPSNSNDLFKKCCKSAPVEKWANDCALYCLSVDQKVEELRVCLVEAGVNPGTVFCNGNGSSSATGKPQSSGTATATGTQTGTSGTASAAHSSGAAVAAVPQGVSKAGLGMLAVLVVSAAAGAML